MVASTTMARRPISSIRNAPAKRGSFHLIASASKAAGIPWAGHARAGLFLILQFLLGRHDSALSLRRWSRYVAGSGFDWKVCKRLAAVARFWRTSVAARRHPPLDTHCLEEPQFLPDRPLDCDGPIQIQPTALAERELAVPALLGPSAPQGPVNLRGSWRPLRPAHHPLCDGYS